MVTSAEGHNVSLQYLWGQNLDALTPHNTSRIPVSMERTGSGMNANRDRSSRPLVADDASSAIIASITSIHHFLETILQSDPVP
jgi:hypothetical protein